MAGIGLSLEPRIAFELLYRAPCVAQHGPGLLQVWVKHQWDVVCLGMQDAGPRGGMGHKGWYGLSVQEVQKGATAAGNW